MNDNQEFRTAGNRFSLRNKASNQIKRIDSLSNTMGAIGDFLVSTWGGIMLGLATLAVGIFLIFSALSANGGATLVQNIIPAIGILIAIILLAINVLMTNPSMGSQFLVSVKFLINKVNNNSKRGKTVDLSIFKLSERDDVVETPVNGRVMVMAVYSLRGSVSPVSFADELGRLERLDKQLLMNMERDTVISSINSIQKAVVKPIPLPANTTPAMLVRRDRSFKVVSDLKHNQQLKTVFTVACYNETTLRQRVEMVERVFNSGLVVGYQRLSGQALKNEIKRIYG